jgi:cytochrome c2
MATTNTGSGPCTHKENSRPAASSATSQEIVTEMADTLDAGREIFRLRGCMACHRYEGFDREADELGRGEPGFISYPAEGRMGARSGFSERKATAPAITTRRRSSTQHANDLKVRIERHRRQDRAARRCARSLVREVKKVGPSLKEVRMKMRKEWMPEWLKDPHKWRPGTKMPTFRLDRRRPQAIAAFIWQSGVTGQLPQQKAGDPVKGKEAFETRGCMACHSMGEGGEEAGRHVRRESEPRGRKG